MWFIRHISQHSVSPYGWHELFLKLRHKLYEDLMAEVRLCIHTHTHMRCPLSIHTTTAQDLKYLFIWLHCLWMFFTVNPERIATPFGYGWNILYLLHYHNHLDNLNVAHVLWWMTKNANEGDILVFGWALQVFALVTTCAQSICQPFCRWLSRYPCNMDLLSTSCRYWLWLFSMCRFCVSNSVYPNEKCHFGQWWK